MKQVTIAQEFAGYCDEMIRKYQIPGVAIGLAKDGEVFYEQDFGYRNTGKQLPVSSDTVFGIGSVTKSFTCVAILQLQEAGKLTVQDQVIQYLPEFKTPSDNYTEKMTIHHFMTHTSGLPPLPTLFSALKRSIENDPKDEAAHPEVEPSAESEQTDPLAYIDTQEEFFQALAAQDYTLLGAPGTEFSYSNECYALLGIIIERASGIAYEQYIKENILDPIGMKHTVFHLEELDGHADIATLYNSKPEGDRTLVFESDNPWDAPPMRAAGFLKSTVNDMLKYAGIFSNQGRYGQKKILSPDSINLITTEHVQCDYDRFYGYGVMVTPDFFGYKLIDHGGSIKGVSAHMNIIPELGLTGIALANLSGVPSETLLRKAFVHVLDKPFNASHLDLPEVLLSEEQLKEYEGMYTSGEGASHKFHVKDGVLQLNAIGFPETTLHALGDDWFGLKLNDMDFRARFLRDGDRKIYRVAFGFRQTSKVEGGC